MKLHDVVQYLIYEIICTIDMIINVASTVQYCTGMRTCTDKLCYVDYMYVCVLSIDFLQVR